MTDKKETGGRDILSRREMGESEAIDARVRPPRVVAVEDVLPRCSGGRIVGGW